VLMPLSRNWKSRWPIGTYNLVVAYVQCQQKQKQLIGARKPMGSWWGLAFGVCVSGQHLLQSCYVEKKNKQKKQSTCLAWANNGAAMPHMLIVAPHLPVCAFFTT